IKAMQESGDKRQMVVVGADGLLNEDSLVVKLPDHDVLLAASNPMQFKPYLYEGHSARLREKLSGLDVRMRLIAINSAWYAQPVSLQKPYPGVVSLTLRLPQGRIGAHEPLLVSGSTGQ